MNRHFSAVAGRYRELRTADLAPVLFLRDHLPRRASVGLDVGCGTGRYTERLYQQLPAGTGILAVDLNREMLSVLKARRAGGARIWPVQGRAEELPLPSRSVDWVVTFNAAHHLDLPGFLRKVADILKPGGRLFIYTRTPEQNARSVWGRFFPKFSAKETRLLAEPELRDAVEATGRLGVASVETFRYERTSTPQRLRQQAEHAHYSTFRLYGRQEFEDALRTFLSRLPGPVVRWWDENLMIVSERRT